MVADGSQQKINPCYPLLPLQHLSLWDLSSWTATPRIIEPRTVTFPMPMTVEATMALPWYISFVSLFWLN